MEGSTIESARSSFQINVLGPLTLIEGLMEKQKTRKRDGKMSLPRCVINVSSSEGELGYLHSNLVLNIHWPARKMTLRCRQILS